MQIQIKHHPGWVGAYNYNLIIKRHPDAVFFKAGNRYIALVGLRINRKMLTSVVIEENIKASGYDKYRMMAYGKMPNNYTLRFTPFKVIKIPEEQLIRHTYEIFTQI